MARSPILERKTQTARERSRRACQRHLKDLTRAHVTPPPDVALKPTKSPMRLAPAEASSSCTSPAALCAELMS